MDSSNNTKIENQNYISNKDQIEIQEILILPPIDIPLFLALHDGWDKILLEVLLNVEKELGIKTT